MKQIMIAAAALLLSSASLAQQQQPTIGERYHEGGMRALSQIEEYIANLLIANDVPLSCIGDLTLGDVGMINTILQSDDPTNTQRNRAAKVLENRCVGEFN